MAVNVCLLVVVVFGLSRASNNPSSARSCGVASLVFSILSIVFAVIFVILILLVWGVAGLKFLVGLEELEALEVGNSKMS